MQLENIFELIRREDVVLWIGSGFSLYAGYPNGSQLANKIYENLTSSQKRDIPANLSLIDLAEQFVRLKCGSRNELNSIIKAEFSKKPSSLKWHQVLANIPHIKTIITTNYDHLFENAYGDNIHVILSPTDIAYRNKKAELFKVHGDMNHPDTIIITRDDYANFFYKKATENLVWTAVKERISCKSVVFIGYDLEDDNIKAILKEISDSLGPNRKEMFLIAPNFKQHKIQYLTQKGIQYLDYKGEVFIRKLEQNIKENITSDFDKGKVSPNTLLDFFQKNNLGVNLSSVDTQFKISSVRGLNGNAKGNLVMQLKRDRNFADSFYEFATGKRFGQVVLDSSNLERVNLLLNGIKLFDDTTDYRIILSSHPKKEGKCTVVFDDGSEFEDICYQVFSSGLSAEVRANYKSCTFKYLLPTENIGGAAISLAFKYEQNTNFDCVNDAISVHRLLLNIATSSGFKLYLNGSSEGVYLKPVEEGGMDTEHIKNSLIFFESLKKIEKHFNIRFANIGNYTHKNLDNVDSALLVVNGSYHVQAWDEELKFNLKESNSLDLLMKIENGSSFQVEKRTVDSIEIYGQKITLGYLLAEPLDLYITNLEDIQTKRTSVAILRSRSKKIKLSYTQSSRASLYEESVEK